VAGVRRSPIGLVRHVGRRSGRSYATPLAVHREDRSLYVPLTYGPNARWCLNVLAAGRCTVRLGGRELEADEPVVVSLDGLPPRLRRIYGVIPIRAFLRVSIVDRP
jgi:deazaflavin-dependent oxidoreductase (nitroreductase family)